MGTRVADLPGRPAASRPTASELQPAMDRARRAIRAIDRQQHRLVGAAAVRRRPEARHVLRADAGGAAARLLLAQLLPRRVPRVAGRPRRRRRELLGVQPRPQPARARPGRADARRAADERVGRHRQPARHRDRRRRRRRAPDGLDALGLQVLERPDHRRRRPGPVPRRRRPHHRQDARSCGRLVRTYAQATAGTPLDDAVRRRRPARSCSATGPTARSTRRPRSSSARCTTRTATPCGSRGGRVVDRSAERLVHVAPTAEIPGDRANR